MREESVDTRWPTFLHLLADRKERAMRRSVLCVWIAAAVLLASGSLWGGEPLVVKTKSGKFVPAAAAEWAPAGKGTYRFVLKAGTSAPAVAKELGNQIAPIQVEAPDDLTLVFRGEGLTEQDLLDKLAGIQIGKKQAVGDALAALSDLGDSGGPALSDLSSAGSIRASKKFELPDAAQREQDPRNLEAKVIRVEPCKPLPTFLVQVLAVPTEGKHKGVFTKGQKIAIRGYYKAVSNKDPSLDPDDPRTKINLKNKNLTKGAEIYGRPFTKDGEVWVLETIEKKK